MYKKILACFLILGFFLLADNLGAEVILNHMMTKDPNSGTGCETPIPNYTFYPRDSRAYCWIDVDDIIEGDLVRYEWYDPSSTLYLDYTHTMSFTGNGCAWDWIDIRNEVPANRPGDWRVDVFYNNTFQFTENFTIEEGVTCPVRQIYGDNSEETELLRIVRDNLLDETPEGREIIKLYYQWSPVIVQAMEQDEAFKKEIKKMIEEVLALIAEEK